MSIEIGAPAVLPLGALRLEYEGDVRTCLLGLTLQHPPVHLSADAADGFVVTGARADVASEYASRFLDYHGLDRRAAIEIELAVPAFVGLGSDALLGLSVARALSRVYDLPADQRETDALARALDVRYRHALETRAFERGGLLVVDPGQQSAADSIVRYRCEIAHDDRDAWALVLFLPRVPAGTPAAVEADRLDTALQAAHHLDAESGRLVTEVLWPTVADDDLAGFGAGLRALYEMNQAALDKADATPDARDDERTALAVMRDSDAVAWGQSITGTCVYGLVRGARASIELRKHLRARLGTSAGIIMATITDNVGAREIVREPPFASTDGGRQSTEMD